MKKTILTAVAAVALLFGAYSNVMAEEPCNQQTECTTSQCQAQQGFETIGEGAENAAVGSYNTVKEGTENAYQTVKEGTENAYDQTKEGTENAYETVKEGTVNAYETVKEGTVNTYEKAKEGTVNLWNKAKEKIHEATE